MNGDVWKTLDWKNSELQGNYNSETDNIKIRHGKKDGIAYIFCSSNSLYKKDDRQDFVSKVVNKDKFEWENITQDIDHEKIIYIRDIWLSWYVVEKNKYLKFIRIFPANKNLGKELLDRLYGRKQIHHQ